jgi:hypothetical protein
MAGSAVLAIRSDRRVVVDKLLDLVTVDAMLCEL